MDRGVMQFVRHFASRSGSGTYGAHTGGMAASSAAAAAAAAVGNSGHTGLIPTVPLTPLQRKMARYAEARAAMAQGALGTRMLPPSMRPRKPRPPPAHQANAGGVGAAAAASASASAQTAAAASATAAAAAAAHAGTAATPFSPLSDPHAAAASRYSISDRRAVSAVDEMQEALAAQLSLVQPADPHVANVVILGTPNAGKSTLVNHLVGQKISAVSHKRNTTRTSVLGVASRDNRQLVLFDTPGVLPKLMSNKYQKELSTAAWDAALGCDVAVVIVDAVKRLGPAEYELLQKAKQLAESSSTMQLILLINKMDLCKPRTRAEALARELNALAPFTHTFYSSVLREKGVDKLEQFLYASTQPREWEYASSARTDQSPSALVVEIVREKIFHRVHQEIPYRVQIANTGWTQLSDGSVRIDLELGVDTRQQKLILTGVGGSMLRYISQRALPEIEALLKCKVHLFLKAYSKD